MNTYRFLTILLLGRAPQVAPILVSLLLHHRRKGSRVRGRLVTILLERWFGVHVGLRATIGTGLRLPHPTSIVIGDGAVIGNNVTLYQGVTLGAVRKGGGKEGNYPRIGDNAVIFSGSAVLGGVEVGVGAIVGANAVVLQSVPAGAVVVGAPARIIKNGIDDE